MKRMESLESAGPIFNSSCQATDEQQGERGMEGKEGDHTGWPVGHVEQPEDSSEPAVVGQIH